MRMFFFVPPVCNQEYFSLYARRQQAVSGVCGLGPFIGEAGTGGFSLLLEAEEGRLESCRELLRNVIDRGTSRWLMPITDEWRPAFSDGLMHT
jgi:hypothetical protein